MHDVDVVAPIPPRPTRSTPTVPFGPLTSTTPTDTKVGTRKQVCVVLVVAVVGRQNVPNAKIGAFAVV